ncbi:uncharacterized protein LOC122250176 [Penaeus japonicus]|uniref:uncharacterized protein LOC122246924 n=1 Tax=Penaeus japonicus TaxID=27405 RepID=UPI001C70B8B3|nr:uncharacterized protein LOC122246924 [Penaeus japonicus]XP_042867442.1 uncharacterized protein LOC122250176 [Penaeus japonicus]
MAGIRCTCTPLVCAKCPLEYKNMKQLKQHLEEKHHADRKQISLISRKHLELKKRCTKCKPQMFGISQRRFSNVQQLPDDSDYKMKDINSCKGGNAYPCGKMCKAEGVVIDTDDSECDDNDYDEDFEDDFIGDQVSFEMKCTCPKLKCVHCPGIFSKCRDLWNHMNESDHRHELYFKTVRLKKKKLKSMCPMCSEVKVNFMKGRNSGKVVDIGTDSQGSRNELSNSVSNDMEHLLCIQSIENCQSVELSAAPEAELGGRVSPMAVIKSANEADHGSPSLLVITISEDEAGLPVSRVGDYSEQKENHINDESFPLHLSMRKCLEQCLQLLELENSYEMKTFSFNEDSSRQKLLNNATKLTCFLCSESFEIFAQLKDHLIEKHFLKIWRNEESCQNSKFVKILCDELKNIDCKCSEFICQECKAKFSNRVLLLKHMSESLCRVYSPQLPQDDWKRKIDGFCNQCIILQKLWIIDYALFITVLKHLDYISSEQYTALLHCYPPKEPIRKSQEINSSNGEKSKDLYTIMLEEETVNANEEFEIHCYCILQPECRSPEYTACVCPMLKCPKCPQTACNFSELRRHTRLNNHNNYNAMRLIWNNYKYFKKNCPSCKDFVYHNYILCPHCPHLHFEEEDKASNHMDIVHGRTAAGEEDLTCTCTNVFLCLTCQKYYRTPQGLHHHMRRLGHETAENFEAIPKMIKEKLAQRKKCPHCSLLTSSACSEAEECEEQPDCTCKWAVCKTCGNSYRKVSSLLSHMKKMGHQINDKYIQSEREKVAASFKACLKCNSNDDRFCIFCNKRENFVYHHIRTHHQDQLIMLLSDENMMNVDEYQANSLKYECSICLRRFSHTPTLRCHVRKVHPHHYFTLQCLNLESDGLTMNDFAVRDKIRVIGAVPLKKPLPSKEKLNLDVEEPSTSKFVNLPCIDSDISKHVEIHKAGRNSQRKKKVSVPEV